MKQRLMMMLLVCMHGIGQTIASNVLVVDDINLPQGGQAVLEIGCDFETEYTAFELQLSLPDGMLLASDDEGKPIVELAFDGNHSVSGNLLPSNGNYKFTCYSNKNLPLPINGPLIRVTVVADANLAAGSKLNAAITACEVTRATDSMGEELEDLEFAITISETRTILDEKSTTAPVAETDADVRVLRTIPAGEWGTICLPFAMTEEQVEAAFGDDVQLADFNDYDYDETAGSISVKFKSTTSIEANHPYIIKVSRDVTEFTVDGVDVDPQEAVVDFDTSRRKNQPRQMVGTYVAQTELEWGTLFLSGGQFWYSTGQTHMKAFRAYFNFIDLIPDFEDNYESRLVSFSFDDSTAAGIEDKRREATSGKHLYDLQGRPSAATAKGIYVKEGKKIIIK